MVLFHQATASLIVNLVETTCYTLKNHATNIELVAMLRQFVTNSMWSSILLQDAKNVWEHTPYLLAGTALYKLSTLLYRFVTSCAFSRVYMPAMCNKIFYDRQPAVLNHEGPGSGRAPRQNMDRAAQWRSLGPATQPI